MFYNQPLAHRFGTTLACDIEGGIWNRVEMAVAWVRHSGMRYLSSPFEKFLRRGGFAQITVGVDIENTSVEGLKDLLSLEEHGNMEVFIHHNEAQTTFHPKVYLLRNDSNARLIVGSNNLTQAGLFINTEAGLQLDAPVADPLICDARVALAAWRDTDSGFAKRLDTTLLTDLRRLGYIFPESEIARRVKTSQEKSKMKRPTSNQALFKMQRVIAPALEAPGSQTPIQQVPGTVLLMRVRRASESARRTQIQIPIRVVRTNFFTGLTMLVSAHDGRSHELINATARGTLNTIKIEIPEIQTMADPVLRLERTEKAIVYRAFDSSSVLGRPIHQALLHGFQLTPPATNGTIPDREKATWWRFI